MFRVKKVLNHNTLIGIDMKDSQEYLLIGKGIGFGRKVSERLDAPEGCTVYSLQEKTERGSAMDLIREIDPVFLEIAEQVLKEGERIFGKIDWNILFPMADHIAFAVKRLKNGEQISNPLTGDIIALFHMEYKAAECLRPILRERLQLEIDEHEIGYVALHIHSAIEDENVALSMQIAGAVRECIRMVEEETGQTIIAGMGELHLEIIVDRLLREFKVEANVGAPQVAYKETIRKAVDQETKYARQSGGKGQYGHVKIHVEPNEPGKGYEFLNSVVGGAIPKEYIPAVDAGIQGAMQAGVMAGFPVVDVKVTLYDGSLHEVDSSEMAFKIAGSMAFKEACRKANPTILEPIMKVAVVVPADYMGDVIGDISARRGSILGMIPRNGATQIDANVPLAEMFGYATDLRSKTQGRGQYSMEPSHYEELPKSKSEEIVSKRARG